jgi:hypothetical protein
MYLVLVCIHVTALSGWAQKEEAKQIGYELKFHGIKDANGTASYNVDIRFHGATEDWEFDTWLGIIPYSPEGMRDHMQKCLANSKIETSKVGETGLVIIGYRTPDGILHRVKSVKITPRNGTPEDKMPTIKDTRPKT